MENGQNISNQKTCNRHSYLKVKINSTDDNDNLKSNVKYQSISLIIKQKYNNFIK